VGEFEIDTLDGLLQGRKYLENILNLYINKIMLIKYEIIYDSLLTKVM